MRLRDIVALLLVSAFLIPYVGYLVNGSMPMIDDPRAMASTGLLFGVLAFWVIRGGRRRLGRFEAVAAVLAVVLYVLTAALAATGAAELLLAAFMLSVLLVFALDLLDRDGPQHDTRTRR